jgi:hypothetical protein
MQEVRGSIPLGSTRPHLHDDQDALDDVEGMDITDMKDDEQALVPYSHCHRCGHTYVAEFAGQEWPKRCTNQRCRNLQFVNPTPISVMLQTVTDGSRIGILTPIRGHAPMVGFPAGTGGFTELTDRSSEHGGARETWEEVLRQLGIPMPDEETLIPMCSRTTGPIIPGRRQLLSFSVNPAPMHVSVFEPFVGDAETTSIDFSWGPRVLAFPSHTYALARYFRDHQGMDVPDAHIVQPITRDVIETAEGQATVFETHYAQPLLDQGIWSVLLEDGGAPVAVIRDGSAWRAV